MLIGGNWTQAESGETFRCTDPYTGEDWGSVPRAAAADVDSAVRAAAKAFEDWARTPPARRSALLRRLGELVEANVERIAATQVRENGKLLSEMRGGTRSLAADCAFYGALGETVHGYTVQPSIPDHVAYTRREPIGVIAAITPWNSPLTLLGWKLLPALAAGNTVVIKPSEVTPVSTLLLGELIDQAGFPPGVVNIVTGFGRGTGDVLVANPLVDKIAFTGSTATGTAIAKVAAERHARISLELGGKSPNIVFDDADLDAALTGIEAGIFAATGQSCNAGSRVLVQAGVYDDVAAMLAERARAMRAGDPLDPATELGPLASHAQLGKVTSYFDIARSEGLRCLAGGNRLDRPGFFVAPTVFDRVPSGSRLAREEIFGPVASLIRFETEEETIAIANDTPFGLASGVWTRDLARAHRMIAAIRAGVVWVNTYRMGGHSMPFGGMKASGIGREMGIDALDAFTEVKSVWINIGAGRA
jgi:aldehyde dehydrogenase (NAD+)